ncbi:MAG: cell division protein SepF [Clostridiales bacterium]|jgi:cell division inhibitor SepF|nr:cell division protein SepF [Clostridiales bacterium]
MAKWLKNFLQQVMLGVNPEEEEIYEDMEATAANEDEETQNAEITRLDSVRGHKYEDKNKILNFRTGAQMQVMITYPKEIVDATDICDYLRKGHVCVVNLEGVERSHAQRIADFLSGAVYVIDGAIERINTNIFISAPSHVHINGESEEELSASNILPWIASSFK